MIPIVWNLIKQEPKTCTRTKGWIEEVNGSCGGERVGGLAKHTKQSNTKIALRNVCRTRWNFVWYQLFEIWFNKSSKHVHEQRDELKKWMNHVWRRSLWLGAKQNGLNPNFGWIWWSKWVSGNFFNGALAKVVELWWNTLSYKMALLRGQLILPLPYRFG
jgi:hypothetical protein